MRMVEYTNPKGEVYHFHFDLDRLAEYEETHPDYSIYDDFTEDAIKRVSTVNRLAGFLGISGFKEFGEAGFDVSDLPKVLIEALRETGFIPRSPEASSTENAPA